MTLVELKTIAQNNLGVIDYLLKQGEMIYAKNKQTGKVKSIRIKALYENDQEFWLKANGNWQFYLDKDIITSALAYAARNNQKGGSGSSVIVDEDEPRELEEVPESSLRNNQSSRDSGEEQEPGNSGPPDMPPNYGKEYGLIKSMDNAQRTNLLQERKHQINEALSGDPRDRAPRLEALAETTRDTALVNRAAIQEAMAMESSEAKNYTRQVVENTEEIIRMTSRLIQSESILHDDMMARLVEKSNGTVVQHMTRVFVNAFSFLHYYNDMVSTSSIVNKLRVRFNSLYKGFYRQLLPHLHTDHVTLERVFLGGMRILTDQEINKFGVGFLVHDIGKADDIEYHEGEAAYDRDTVVAHVKRGYQAIMNKTGYSREAALITGYHHEYYGDSSGYGYFREFLANYKQANPKASVDFCMAFDMEGVIDYQALSYFPAKVLEIVDVFDSLTDKNRRYRKPLSPEEALKLIHDEFIVAKPKIDPILFDFFVDFFYSQPGSDQFEGVVKGILHSGKSH